MRRNYPKRVHRDPAEHYDVVYDSLPGCPHISRIIDHPRKLVTINLLANPWIAVPEEIFIERTCFDEEMEETF